MKGGRQLSEWGKIEEKYISCETECIICGAAVPLANYEREGVYIKVCDECKRAVRYAKALYEANHIEPVLLDAIDNGDGTITLTKSREQE